MPQLNPTPWFAIFVFSWIIFLTVIPPKILSHLYPNEPVVLNPEKTKTAPWPWPWH